MRIDALASLFYNGLSLPIENKGIGVPKPLFTRGEYITVRIGETENLNAEQGGIHNTLEGGANESWHRTEMMLDIIVIEPHDLEGSNTYSLMATSLERTQQEIRNLNLYHRDFEVLDWWITSTSEPDLSDGEGETQVIQATISVIVEWAEIWSVGG